MSVETLRDRFAMAALTGFFASGGTRLDLNVQDAYRVADLMLAARGDAAPQPTGDAVKQQMLEALKYARVVLEEDGFEAPFTLGKVREAIAAAEKEATP